MGIYKLLVATLYNPSQKMLLFMIVVNWSELTKYLIVIYLGLELIQRNYPNIISEQIIIPTQEAMIRKTDS